jgi:serine/threonine protein kinase
VHPPKQTTAFAAIDRMTERLPYPIARAWADSRARSDDAACVAGYVQTFEVILRTLLAFLLPDYLRGEPEAAVERLWPNLVGKPGRRDYVDMLRAVTAAIRERAEPGPFIREPATWFLDGKESGAEGSDGASHDPFTGLAALLDQLDLREHGTGPSLDPEAWRELRLDLERRVAEVLGSLEVLAGYRMVSVSDTARMPDGGHLTSVHTLTGPNHSPEASQVVLGAWLPTQPRGRLFLANPNGDEWLSVMPFAMMVTGRPNEDPASGGRPARSRIEATAGLSTARSCHLFKAIEDNVGGTHSPRAGGLHTGRLVLTDDGAGSIAMLRLPVGEAEPVLFTDWLKDRWARADAAIFATGTHVGPRFAGRVGALDPHAFRKEAEIGRGAIATVHRATMSGSGRAVAYKLLDRVDDYDRLEREVQCLRALAHPNIVPLIGCGHDVSRRAIGQPFVVMELMEGGTLARRVVDGRVVEDCVPEEQIIRWGAELLDALREVHAAQIVHGNIRPSNCLLDRDGRVALADFGIGHLSADHASPEQLARLPGAPSGADPRRPVGPPTDVYSLGLTLYVTLTGNNPRTTAGVGAVGDGVSAPLAALLRQMCRDAPDERPTAKSACATMWEILEEHLRRSHAPGRDAARRLARHAEQLRGITLLRRRLAKRRDNVEEALRGAVPAVVVEQYSEWLREAPEDPHLWDSIKEQAPRGDLGAALGSAITGMLGERRLAWSMGLNEGLARCGSSVPVDPDAIIASAVRWQGEAPDDAVRLLVLDELYSRLGRANPAPRRTAAELLSQRLESLEREGRWREMVETLQGRARKATDRDAQIRDWSRVAAVSTTHLRDARQALDAWEHVLALDAAHGEAPDAMVQCLFSLRAWDRLEALMRRQGRLDALADQYEALTRRPDTAPEDRLALLLRGATFARDDLQRPARAAHMLGIACALRPTDRSLLRRQLACLREAEDWAQVASVLEALESQVTDDPGELRRLRLELASVQIERLGDCEAGARTLERVAEVDPSDQEILGRLEALHEASGDWARLAGVRSLRLQHGLAGSARIPVLEALGLLQEGKLKQEAQGVITAEELFALQPGNRWAGGVLDRAYERGASWEKLLDLRKRMALHATPGERAARWAMAATIADERFPDQLALAIELWGHVLRAEPANPRALLRLEELYAEAKIPSALVEVIAGRASTAATVAEKVAALHRLAEASHDDAKDVEGATRAWASILELSPSDRVAQNGLKRALIRARDWDGLGRLLGLAGRLAEFSPALQQASTDAAASDAQRRVALDALRGHQRRSGEWRALAPTLLRLVALSGDDRAGHVALLLELADVQFARLGSSADATRTLSTVLAIDPGNDEARRLGEQIDARRAAPERRLAELKALAQQGSWEEADKVAARVCSLMETLPFAERPEAWRLVGDVRTAMSRLPEATEAYEHARRLAPGDAAWPGAMPSQVAGVSDARALEDRVDAAVSGPKSRGPSPRGALPPASPRLQGRVGLEALRSRLDAEPRSPALLVELHRFLTAVGRLDEARCAAATARYLGRAASVDARPPGGLVLERPGSEGEAAPRILPEHWARMIRPLDVGLTPVLHSLLVVDRPPRSFQLHAEGATPAVVQQSVADLLRSARWLADALHGDRVLLSQTSEDHCTIDFRTVALHVSDVGPGLLSYPSRARTFVLARHLAHHHPSLRPRVALAPDSSLMRLFSTCVDEARDAQVSRLSRPPSRLPQAVPGTIIAALEPLVRVRPNLAAELDRWCETVDRVALDVAFAFTGDLGVAHAMLEVPFGLSPRLSPSALSNELIRFSVSEEYFALRKAFMSPSAPDG